MLKTLNTPDNWTKHSTALLHPDMMAANSPCLPFYGVQILSKLCDTEATQDFAIQAGF